MRFSDSHVVNVWRSLSSSGEWVSLKNHTWQLYVPFALYLGLLRQGSALLVHKTRWRVSKQGKEKDGYQRCQGFGHLSKICLSVLYPSVFQHIPILTVLLTYLKSLCDTYNGAKHRVFSMQLSNINWSITTRGEKLLIRSKTSSKVHMCCGGWQLCACISRGNARLFFPLLFCCIQQQGDNDLARWLCAKGKSAAYFISC